MFYLKRHVFLFFYILIVLFFYLAVLLNYFNPSYIYLSFILAFIPIFWTAIYELKDKQIGTEFFLVIASIIGLAGQQEQAITSILLIMLIAMFFESLIEDRTDRAIKSLMTLMPQKVIALIDGKERIIQVDSLEVGMEILVKTGGLIPVDGKVISGQGAINESFLTGESISKEKNIDDIVYAGTFVESGSIIIKALKVGQDTFYSKIKELVEKSEESKAKIATVAQKVAFILVPTMLLFILLVWIITGDTQLVITLLVFGSPLELTLITPLTILAGVVAGFRHGIVIKGGLVLEKLAKVDLIVFDKTGTITIGQPKVVEITSLNSEYSENKILEIAAIAEKNSAHPIAKAVLSEAQKRNLVIPNPDKYISLSGHGNEIIFKGIKYFSGNKHFIEAQEHSNIKFQDVDCAGRRVHSSFYVATENQICGKICLSDVIRPEAIEIIDQLKKLKINNFYILSGDSQKITNSIANILGITNAHGDMFPDDKIKMIKSLQQKGHIVAMVGDGINDAPSIKQADIGIAMGAMGMEPAIEAADIVLLTNDLNKIVFVFKLSQEVLKVIKQNIFIGFILIHAVGIILAFMGLITPIQAALFHAIPDLAIVLNSARLIRFTGI